MATNNSIDYIFEDDKPEDAFSIMLPETRDDVHRSSADIENWQASYVAVNAGFDYNSEGLADRTAAVDLALGRMEGSRRMHLYENSTQSNHSVEKLSWAYDPAVEKRMKETYKEENKIVA